MKKEFTLKPHWASQTVNVFCGECRTESGEIILADSSIVCEKCAARQGIILPPPVPITITNAIARLQKRGIAQANYRSVHRWCRDGLLPATWDELSNRYRPYLDGVENFTPPKKGNPKIHLLRRKTLRKKYRKTERSGNSERLSNYTLNLRSEKRPIPRAGILLAPEIWWQ